MSTPLVSVIVPTYNVERYVEECIDSLLNQTYEYTEIIVIDDGSKDATVYLLEKYADKINLTVHADNKGQGARRNEGIKKARGNYLYFVDSDDWIEPDTIEKAVEKLEKTDADLVRFNGKSFIEGDSAPAYEGSYSFSDQLEEDRIYNQEESLQRNRKSFSASPCLYMVKKEVIDKHDLHFLEGVLHEDEYFTTLLFTVIQNMIYLNRDFYHRRYRAASTMTENTDAHKVKSFESYLEVFKALEEEYTSDKYSKNQKSFIKRQLVSVYNGLQQSGLALKRKKELRPLKVITLKDKAFLFLTRFR